jgi:hypothetical protein
MEVPPESAALVGSAKSISVGVLDPKAPLPAGGVEQATSAEPAPPSTVVGG